MNKLQKGRLDMTDNKGEISDGYHTFNELYEHRHVLFANVVNRSSKAWKSKLHDDGTMFDGWFIVGMPTKNGDITYHIPLKHWELFRCKELGKAPKWDGHTSDDVIKRLKIMASSYVSPVTPTWQPIETAPKDGTMILVCLPRQMNLIIRSRYCRVHKYWLSDYKGEGGICKPHFYHKGDVWMPLPEKPKQQSTL